MNHTISNKLRPLFCISVDCPKEGWRGQITQRREPFVFLTQDDQVYAYVYMDDLTVAGVSISDLTIESLQSYATPIDHVGELKPESSASLPFIFQILGEHVALIKNEQNEYSGYIRREDALVELFRQDHNINLLKVMLSSIPMGIFVVDGDTKIVNCNESGLKMIKSSSEQVINIKAGKIFNQDHINQALSTGETLLNQLHITDEIGVLVDYSPIFNDDKQVDGMIIIVQDLPMVEEMAMEIEYVKDLNTDLNAILTTMYDEILVVNHRGELLRYSDNFIPGFWGVCDLKELVGKSLLDLEKQGVFNPSVVRLVLDKKKKVSVVQTTPNGKSVLAVGNPVLNEKGDIHRIIVASRDITETKKLKSELRETKKLSKNYKEELEKLKKSNHYVKKSIIYCSPQMEQIMDKTRKLADFNSTVLVLGESGVGKELIAKSIHKEGKRADQLFLTVNCGAISEDLLESELFGYTKGAFTGADSRGKIGFFEQADKGILFLDEIGEIPLRLQVKLLRVLQEKEVIPVGSTKPIPIDVQIIAATNRDLEKMVREGSFREDLYYRIHVIPIQVPPLRERPEDVPLLAFHFIQQLNEQYNKNYHLSPEALNLLEVYDWPGNIRELQNLIERLVVTADDDVITADFVNQSLKFGESKHSKPVITGIVPYREAQEHLEEQLILLAMKKYKTTTKAAEALEISQSAISRKYQKILQRKANTEPFQ